MEWFWGVGLLAIAFILIVLGKQIYKLSKRVHEEDGELELLFEIIDLVLTALEKETKRRLSELEQAEVEAAARDVYRRFIAATPARHFVDEAGFVRMVVEQWRKIAGVEQSVSGSIAAVWRAKGLEQAP